MEWKDASRPVRRRAGGEPGTSCHIVCGGYRQSNAYVVIVEFPSYEDAMRNSGLPATQRFAVRLQAISREEPRFLNLDELYGEQG